MKIMLKNIIYNPLRLDKNYEVMNDPLTLKENLQSSKVR